MEKGNPGPFGETHWLSQAYSILWNVFENVLETALDCSPDRVDGKSIERPMTYSGKPLWKRAKRLTAQVSQALERVQKRRTKPWDWESNHIAGVEARTERL
jgi:hypothetical protein